MSDGQAPLPARSRGGRRWWIVGLAGAAVVVVAAALFAAADPDGLLRIAGDQGFLGQARDALFSILPGYVIPGLDGDVSRILAGLIGIAIVFAIMLLVGRVIVRRPH